MAKRTPLGTFGTRRRAIGPLGWALRGAAAGAAGTTALNAVTYLDMAVRGRPSSSTPEDTVEKLAETVHVQIPGDREKREHRIQGLGPMTVLGVTDPRTWSAIDWISDVVPHLAYGAVVKGTMNAFDRG